MAIAQNLTQKKVHVRKIHIYYAQMRARSLMQNNDDDENDWNLSVKRDGPLFFNSFRIFHILCDFIWSDISNLR